LFLTLSKYLVFKNNSLLAIVIDGQEARFQVTIQELIIRILNKTLAEHYKSFPGELFNVVKARLLKNILNISRILNSKKGS